MILFQSNSSKPVTQSATKANDTTSQRHITSQQSALKGSAQNEVIYPRNEEVYDLLLFFANTRSQIKDYLVKATATWYQMVPLSASGNV